jgi:hypothetical protein
MHMIGLLIVITLGVYFGIKLAQEPAEPAEPAEPVNRKPVNNLTFLTALVVVGVLLAAFIAFVQMASAADLPKRGLPNAGKPATPFICSVVTCVNTGASKLTVKPWMT